MKGYVVPRNERGFALVVSILILLVMTLLALVLMAGVSMNRSLAGNDQRMRAALNIAEAGGGEAMARIRNQETLMDPNDPNDVCQVFNTAAGSVPALGTDSIGLATGQPAASRLEYTTATRGPDVLTINWKKNPAGTRVLRYDGTLNPAVNTTTGVPIYVITSTGRVESARRTVVSEVIQKTFIVNAKAAMAADIPINFVGNAYICGFDHFANTPYNDGDEGRALTVPSPDPHRCLDNELGNAAGNLPGAWSSSSVTGGGASGASGNPTSYVQNQPGFYAGPWDAFSMSQSEYYSWIGSPVSSSTTWNGIYYVDNNSITQDHSAKLALHSVDGEGFLYVDGDLSLNAGFHYKGLIYVEGDLNITGQVWILGGLIVKGESKLLAAGGMTVLYSSDAVSQALAKYGGQFVTLNWREQ